MGNRRITMPVFAAVIASILSVAVAGAFSLGKYEKVRANGGTVVLATAKLSDNRVHYYKFDDGGKEIAFFAVKAADNSFRTAFDACDSCYKAKKGYEQQGDKLNCKNCNQKFVINRLGPNATGGCNPGYLPHQASGNNLIIKVEDLKGGARYF